MDRGVFHRTVTRRRLVGILLGTAAASLAACAPSAPAQPTQPAAKPTTGEQKPAAQPTTAPKPTAAPAQAGTVDLRLWILKTYVEPTNKAIEASAAEWAQKNNAKVTVEYFTFEDMSTKYVAAIETGSTPDVGQLETFAPVRFAGMGQLLDLTDFSKSIEGEVGTPFENVRPVMFGPDGKVVSIPWYTMHGFLYVWRDMLEQAGLKNPTTFEEWKQVGKALTKADQNLYGIGHSWNRTTDGYGVMQSLMFSYGASWCDEKGAYKSIQTPEMKAAMTWATDIYKEKIVPPDALSWSGSANNEAFIARKVATTHNGPSITFALEDQVAKAKDAKEKAEKERLLENAVALHSPAGPAAQRSWAVAMSFGVFKSTKHPDKAMDLIRHLVSPEQTLKVMQQSYGQFAPVLSKGREAAADYFNKNENYRRFGEAAKYFVATGWPGQPTPAAAEVVASNVLTDMAAKVIVDGWTVDQTLEWGDQKIKEIYDSLGNR